MKYTRRDILIALFIFLFVSNASFSNTLQMNETLVRINSILNQINPLINLAEAQENSNSRVKFQFNVLRNDISKIQLGILQAVKHISIQPRMLKPLSGDYLSPLNAMIKK